MATHEKAFLRFVRGPLKGRVYVLSDLSVFDIGRGDGCQVKLDDPGVAMNHARIYRKGETWTFFDLNTEQGSQVNDIPLEKRELEGGEIIKLGATEMQFTFTPPGKTPAPAPESAPPAVAPAPQVATPPQIAPMPPAPPPMQPQPQQPVMPATPPVAPPTHYAPPPPPVAPAAQEPAPSVIPDFLRPPVMPGAEVERQMPTQPHVVPASRNRCSLVVIDGDPRDVGKRLDLRTASMILIGRALDCDFMLSDGKVSRHHTRLELHPDGHIIVDLNSANGTVVNGQRVERVVLQSGDYVRLGFTVLTYEVVPEAVTA